MRMLLNKKLAVVFLWLFAAICYLCSTEAYCSVQQQPDSQSDAGSAENESTVVARIAYYTITRGELTKKLMNELYPHDYDYYDANSTPVSAKEVLEEMLAEKAMIIEARAQDYLEIESIRDSVKKFADMKLAGLLIQKHIEGKVNVTDDEVAQKMQTNPKLDKARAEAMLKQEKAKSILDQYYSQIYSKAEVEKISANYPKVIQIYIKLLRDPNKPRKVPWVENIQVKEGLTQEEKNLVLAHYRSGKVTLKDWFQTLGDIVPIRRPRNLNTTKGVEQVLERAMQTPLLVSEAKRLKLDKDPELLKQIRDFEDRKLLSEVMLSKHKAIKEPTTDQIIAYFSKNKEMFGVSKSLKINQIWCQDLKTAKQVRAALDNGEDFEAVKEQYSLEKQSKPLTVAPHSEGIFWKDLSAGDPNSIIGPVKGFYSQGIRWRIVKILQKTPGKEKPYSSDVEREIKYKLINDRFNAEVDRYGKELLKKYSYQIFSEIVEGIDPLDIP